MYFLLNTSYKIIMIEYEQVLNNIATWCEDIGNYQMLQLKTKNFNVLSKDCPINYVSDVDYASEKKLRSLIRKAYPSHTVLGEEYGREGESDYVWVIDPIDGTTNYIHGFPVFSISVALKYKDEIKVGMVYAPMLNMKYSAIKRKGAFFNGHKIKVSENGEFIKCLLSTSFNTNRLEDNINLKYFNYLIEHVCDIRQMGSSALELCLTAAGMLDGFWHFDLKEWDYSAGALILREAGGVINHFKKNEHDLLISGNEKVCKLLEDIIYRDSLSGER